MRKLAIARGKQRTRWIDNGEVTWPQLSEKLLGHRRIKHTVAEYQALPPDEKGPLKAARGYMIGGPFEGRERKKDELKHRSVVTLDIDHCEDPQRVIDSYDGYEFVMHSTLSHTDESPRLRLVFPLSRDVTPFEYEAVARNLAAWHGMNDFDDTTFQVSRIMYWPIACSDAEPIAYHGHGDWVNPDDWEPAQDFMDWPRSDRVGSLVPPGIKAADPFAAPGIIGAFNRTYDIHAAIALFLPDVFEPTEFENRYRPYGATGEAGAVVYDDDSQMYVNHEHPEEVSNRLSNAFDLVRLVKFGYLDAGDDEPMMQRASFKEMVRLLADDNAVRAEIETPDIDDELPEFEDQKPKGKTYDQFADEISAMNTVEPSQLDMLFASVATYNPIEQDMLLKLMQPLMDPEPTLKSLNAQLANVRKGLVGVSLDGEPADVERELVDEILTEHFEGGAHIRRAGKVYWEYVHGVWRMTDDEAVEGRIQDTLVRLREERPDDVAMLVAAIGDTKTSSLVGALSRLMRGRLAKVTARDDDPLHLLDRITVPVINCLNGEVYVNDDGNVDLKPHDPHNFYTLQVACDYDPDATCPEYDRFMEMVFDDDRWLDPDDMIRHLDELGGYIVNMSRWLKSWVLFHGPTDTGKSTMLSVYKAMLGKSCLAMELGRFGVGNTFADSSLVGRLLLADDDFDKSASLPDGFIKKISEEKVITSDIKFGAPITFTARCLPLVCANHWPVTRDVSDAFRERALVFEFVHRILGAEKSDRRRDLMLLELPGILNRFLAGLARLRARGDWLVPIDCQASHDAWVGQSNQAHMFIDDRLERAAKGPWAKRSLVWNDYVGWQRDQGGQRLSKREFLQRMEELLGEPVTVTGNIVYHGWQLRPPEGLSASDDEL